MKLLTLTCCLTILIINVSAQNTYGVKTGLSLAGLTSSQEGFGAEPEIGFHLGGYADIPLTDMISFNPEIIFSDHGATQKLSGDAIFNGIDTSYELNGNLKMSYLILPLLIRFKPTPLFYFAAGPQLGLILSARYDYSYSLIMGNGTNTTEILEERSGDLKDETQDMELGFSIGTGIELTNGLNFGLRLTHGLTDVYDQGNSDISMMNEYDHEQVKTIVSQISVGYLF